MPNSMSTKGSNDGDRWYDTSRVPGWIWEEWLVDTRKDHVSFSATVYFTQERFLVVIWGHFHLKQRLGFTLCELISWQDMGVHLFWKWCFGAVFPLITSLKAKEMLLSIRFPFRRFRLPPFVVPFLSGFDERQTFLQCFYFPGMHRILNHKQGKHRSGIYIALGSAASKQTNGGWLRGVWWEDHVSAGQHELKYRVKFFWFGYLLFTPGNIQSSIKRENGVLV